MDGQAAADPGLLVAYAPFAKWVPHFETDLEIIQDHLDAGGRVRVLSCDGQLRTCEQNPSHSRIICALCKSRFRSGMRWLQGTGLSQETFYCLDASEETFIESLRNRQWRDIEEVRSFRIDGADIGLAAISSMVSLLREPSPDIRLHHDMLADHLASAAMVYFSLSRKLADAGAENFSVFNGRVSALRPALRAAQKLGVTSHVHERAGYVDRYSQTMNSYPHDLVAIKKDIEDCHSRTGDLSEGGVRQALDWFEERRAGMVQSWHSFTTGQREGLLPDGLDSSVLKVVVFNSSEDEFVAVEEWNNPFYATQNEAISRLLTDVAGDAGIRVFLRVHPNLKGIHNSQTTGIEALAHQHPSLRVIAADSDISSYALIDAADIVVTYGSTVGIEACYARKPSILMGRAMYEDLDVCIKPDSHQAFIELLRQCASGRQLSLPSGFELGLVKYGHFNRVQGKPYRHVVPDGLFGARMQRNGRLTAIRSHWLAAIAYKIYCLPGWLAAHLRSWAKH